MISFGRWEAACSDALLKVTARVVCDVNPADVKALTGLGIRKTNSFDGFVAKLLQHLKSFFSVTRCYRLVAFNFLIKTSRQSSHLIIFLFSDNNHRNFLVHNFCG